MDEPENYEKLGFKSGLEIHQQLDTSKLFCNCPSILRKEEPDFEIKRRLHAVAGEEGKIDEAVKHEASLKKEFIYQGYDTTCLVELDESPPKLINEDALRIAIQISLLLNCKIIPLTQIMRKTVIDGSNTSGFQRTVIIAEDGFVETSYGKTKIKSICLEEDSARIIKREEGKTFFRLDRLGIPLVEITTEPDIKNPEQAKETALHLGNVLRSSKVKRGLGTIRQDVNISIKNGNRIEIKGVQKPELIVKTLKSEIERQKNIIENGSKVISEVRRALPDGKTEFLRPMPGRARMYPETDLPLLKISRNLINEIKANLPKLRKDISENLEKEGLNKEMIKLLFKTNKLELLKESLEIINNPPLIAKILLIYPKEISKRKNISLENYEKKINKEIIFFLLENLKKKKIAPSQIKRTIEEILDGKSLENSIKFEKIDFNEVEENIRKIIKEKPGLSDKAYMGLIMKDFRGKVDGREAMEIIKKYI
jgi:Glu-tRNA(Gln) amidotransferase subunit E-like FAD-binding protein